MNKWVEHMALGRLVSTLKSLEGYVINHKRVARLRDEIEARQLTGSSQVTIHRNVYSSYQYCQLSQELKFTPSISQKTYPEEAWLFISVAFSSYVL